MSNDTIPTKTCTTCNQPFPATLEFFHKRKNSPDGLRTMCKVCRIKYQREYYAKNREHSLKQMKQYRQENIEQIRIYDRNRPEKSRERKREYSKGYTAKNKAKKSEYDRKYRARNHEKLKGRAAVWAKNNPEKFLAIQHRRMARKLSLPDTFTAEQWIVCLEYHHYCCAVCGNQLRDLFGNVEPHADHWIPLASPECPGTVAENMICLCNHCNSSKKATPALQWLIWKYGKKKASEILSRIQTYFEWIAQQIS